MQNRNSKLKIVMRVKDYFEKKTLRELQEIKAQVEIERENLNNLKLSESSALEEAKVRYKVRANDMQVNRAYINNLTNQINEQKNKVTDIEIEEDQKRTELIEKSKERQIIEKLDEKRTTEYNKKKEKSAQAHLDIIAQRTKLGTAPI